MSEAVAELSRAIGIRPDYIDTTGRTQVPPPETLRSLIAAMGLPAGTDAEAREALAALEAERRARPLHDWIIVAAGEAAELPVPGGSGTWRLVLEDGSEALEAAPGDVLALPALPIGLHRIQGEGWTTTVLSAPRQLPATGRGWGITLPLYGLRSAAEGGLGTYRDLAVAAAALASTGAGFVGINPVHAGFPADPRAYSPYSPSHRRRLNIAHVWAPDERPAPDGPLIYYPAAMAARMAALEAGFAAFESGGDNPGFAQFLKTEGASLERFVTHQALSEKYGAYWKDWPRAVQDPGSQEVRRFMAERAARLRFHAWLQWQAERQLGEASRAARDGGSAHGLYLDLAVGTHPFGAETWSNRRQFASGVSLGAPPDAFSADGQTWGLAPFNPLRLVAEGFRPLADTLRKQFQFARLLRIDHVLGFDRAFWVPEAPGLPGTYVQMPREALLAVTRIEAARAGAAVVGEDLGNIPPGLQADLAASGILGCRVAMFERESDQPPRYRAGAAYTEAALASFGTHDLPTWAGWRDGRDVAARQALGLMQDGDAAAAAAYRSQEVEGFDAAAGTRSGTADELHRFLAGSAARLVALQIEDIFGIKEQANLPGTVEIHPNWRRRLPLGVDALKNDPRLAATARLMADNGR